MSLMLVINLCYDGHSDCFWVFVWLLKTTLRVSLVVQWIRICLLMQGIGVWSLVQKYSMCPRATNPLCHKRWTLHTLESMLHNWRSHHSEKPAHLNEDPGQPWMNKVNMLKCLKKNTETHCTSYIFVHLPFQSFYQFILPSANTV